MNEYLDQQLTPIERGHYTYTKSKIEVHLKVRISNGWIGEIQKANNHARIFLTPLMPDSTENPNREYLFTPDQTRDMAPM